METNVILSNIKSDYLVNTEGEIFSTKYGKRNRLRYNEIKGGYKLCNMYLSGVKHTLLVHRVVAFAFMPNLENKPQINHKDGDKSNNCIENLEWVTQSENIKHAYDTKLMTKTFKDCYNASLEEFQVKEIRAHLSNNVKQRYIAEMFGVSEQIISLIKRGKTYRGIGLTSQNQCI